MSSKRYMIGLGLAALLAALLTALLTGCSSASLPAHEQNLSSEVMSEEAGTSVQAEAQERFGGTEDPEAGRNSEQEGTKTGLGTETEQGESEADQGNAAEQAGAKAESNLESGQAEKGQAIEQAGEEAQLEAKAEQAGDQPVAEIAKKRALPEGFVYVDEVLEHAFYEIRYYSEYNFVGEQIDGYYAPFAILSKQAANALKKAELALEPHGYALLIYDAYRPKKAVEHFSKWAADERNIKMKKEFYPDIDKKNVFKLGYLSHRSGHSRGSTVDLTLADQETGEPLDMGGIHDFLGEISAHDAAGLTEAQAENRLLLKETMIAAGFKPYGKEWWHYTLKNEPYPKKYFDFDVE